MIIILLIIVFIIGYISGWASFDWLENNNRDI